MRSLASVALLSLRPPCLVFALVGPLGCAFAEYTPGAIVQAHPPNATRQLGALDVAFDLGRDFERVGYDSFLLTISVGNREARPSAFALAAVEIAARTDDGARVALHFADPRGELKELHVDSYSSVTLHLKVEGRVSPSHVAAVCFDVRGLAPDYPRTSPDDVCFDRTREGFMAVDAVAGVDGSDGIDGIDGAR